MTRKEATELLEVSVNPTADEVLVRYQQIYSDYRIMLTNAPTPELKMLYQGHIHEIETACETLFPGLLSSGGARTNLPATGPVQTKTERISTDEPKLPPSVADTNVAEHTKRLRIASLKYYFARKRKLILLLVAPLLLILAWQLHWELKDSGVYVALPISVGDRIAASKLHIVSKNGDRNSPATGLPLDAEYYRESEACATHDLWLGHELSESDVEPCQK